MFLEIIGWIYFIFTIIFFIYAAIWNFLRLIHTLKDIKNPKTLEYYFKYYYDRPFGIDVMNVTAENIKMLQDLLEELKNTQNK